MSLFFNGVEIPTSGDVSFNGTTFNEVKFNGVTYWLKGGTPPPDAPDAPSFCNASDGTYEDRVLVQWGYSHYDAYYKVYKDGSVVAVIYDGSTWYEDIGVTLDVTHSYYVKACWRDNDICSDASETDTGYAHKDSGTPNNPPATSPTSLLATDGAFDDKVVISWSNGSETNALSVNIYRNGYLMESVPFGATQFIDSTVDPGTTYSYFAKFTNLAGEGPQSNSDTGFALDSGGGDEQPPTTAPTSLQASDGISSSKIIVSWSNGSETNALQTIIYRDGAKFASVPFGATAYYDTSTDGGESHSYAASFANVAGEGPSSTSDTGFTSDDGGGGGEFVRLDGSSIMTGNLQINTASGSGGGVIFHDGTSGATGPAVFGQSPNIVALGYGNAAGSATVGLQVVKNLMEIQPGAGYAWVWHSDPVNGGHLTNKNYVDNTSAKIVASIESNGTVKSEANINNISIDVDKTNIGTYEIDMGREFDSMEYVVNVTCEGNSPCVSVVDKIDYDTLIVRVYDLQGMNVDCDFSLIVYGKDTDV